MTDSAAGCSCSLGSSWLVVVGWMSTLIWASCLLQGTSYGVLQPPLGSSRLAVIALLDSLLSTGDLQAEQAIIDSGLTLPLKVNPGLAMHASSLACLAVEVCKQSRLMRPSKVACSALQTCN